VSGGSPKRIYRSRTDKVVCGFCSGLADYFGVDPVLIRLVFVGLLLAAPFPAFVLYFAGCFVTPEKPPEADGGKAEASKSGPESIGEKRREVRRAALLALGIILVFAGAAAIAASMIGRSLLEALHRFWGMLNLPAAAVGGAILLLVGAALLAKAAHAETQHSSQAQ